MGKGKPKIHEWLYAGEVSDKFLMLPPDLFENKQFQNLSHAARTFYILLCVHKETDQQRGCLLNALRDYNRIEEKGWSEQDLLDEATPNKRTKITHGYFVIPLKHLQQYGYSAAYTNKLKKELIENGFIELVFSGKGKYNAWNLNTTVYRFSKKWKNQK